MRLSVSRSPIQKSKANLLPNNAYQEILKISIGDLDPDKAISTGKLMAKAWSSSLRAADRESSCLTFIYRAVESYWACVHKESSYIRGLPGLFKKVDFTKLDTSVLSVAKAVGMAASKLDVINASYHLGNLYTAVLPEAKRSDQGIFYTPPALTKRLIEISEEAGADWKTARVIDPACGGGAFLAPVVLKMIENSNHKTPEEQLSHIENHLSGYEIDSFGGWLSQVFVEVALRSIIDRAKKRIGTLVTVCDSLDIDIHERKYDLVIGNPPYGRITLPETKRKKFRDSLYGHANLYGVFTHLALNLVKENGVIGYVTPTSFLSGEYFKKLREIIRKVTTPIQVDFISIRKGVFDGVLQETMLAVYKKSFTANSTISVNQLIAHKEGYLEVQNSGAFDLPVDLSVPWILPRAPYQRRTVERILKFEHKLRTWGYQVSTGPLVWNRHKKQLTDTPSLKGFPIVWSEAVTQDGVFKLRSDKRNHKTFFKFNSGNDHLITHKECVILQRTTAKEQEKRLVAAVLPNALIKKFKGVVIENHLNMIIPISETPAVDLTVLACFLNSKAANDSFRTISGSVAVSAYELESLPLPSPEKLQRLRNLIKRCNSIEDIEEECNRIVND
jgi:adenine-specific DNA-methyltransferase